MRERQRENYEFDCALNLVARINRFIKHIIYNCIIKSDFIFFPLIIEKLIYLKFITYNKYN